MFASGSLDQCLRFVRDLTERLHAAIANDRCDQTVIDADGDADIDPLMPPDGMTDERCIDCRMAGERNRCGLDHEVVDGWMHHSVGFILITELLRTLHIDLAGEIKVRDRSFALCRGSCDGFSHLAQRLVCSSRQALRCRYRGFHDVLL